MKRMLMFTCMLLTIACSVRSTSTEIGTHPKIETPTRTAAGLPTPEGESRSQENASTSPIYLTVAAHIEDVAVYARCDAYPDFRDKLLRFAETFAPYLPAVNLQIEYEFFRGVARCETDALKAATDGLNVLDYLAARYGYEIDPHQEGGWDIEGQDNYADIRYLGGQVTGAISETMGGLVWDDPDQWARLAAGEQGQLTPEFTWQPQALTLAVSSRHHLGNFSKDDIASGVWIPQGAGDDFWVHDPGGPFLYIGPGEHDDWSENPTHLSTPAFVGYLLDHLAAGAIPADKMYTVTLAVPQAIIFHPEEFGKLLAVLDELTPFVDSGQAVYVTYSHAIEIWRTQYNAGPSIFFRSGVD